MAIVVRTEDWEHNGLWIKYVDGKGSEDHKGLSGYAMRNNLILVSEA
jgi:hypothetical protein